MAVKASSVCARNPPGSPGAVTTCAACTARAAMPPVPKMPTVVGVNNPLAVSPGAMNPVISIS